MKHTCSDYFISSRSIDSIFASSARLVFASKNPRGSFAIDDEKVTPTAENPENKAKEAFIQYWEKKYPKVAEEKVLLLYQDKPLFQERISGL